MDFQCNEFFQRLSNDASKGNYFEVIPVHDSAISWNELIEKVPKMPKGWYELSRLSSKDRIEFTGEHWCAALSIPPRVIKFIENFFNSLDNVGIFLVKCKKESPFDVQMVYSLKENGGFYRGALPADEQVITTLKKTFSPYILPEDYLAFLRLHDGFWKTTDTTGMTVSGQMPIKYEQFQTLLSKEPVLTTSKGEAVNPKSLIPFYESFGMPYYQCFWGEWYPEQEMGNVYYSSATKTISNTKNGDSSETLAFPTFADWLAFYLEHID